MTQLFKIFIFSSVHPWYDTRIFYKEAVSLAKKFNIELHAPADFSFKEINKVKIYGLPQWEKVLDRRKIRKELWKRIRCSDADVFHFHDPELIWIGLKIKLLKGKKVIYDIHENYPGDILDKEWIPKYFRLLVSFIFDKVENITAKYFDGVVYVNKIVGKRFLNFKNSVCIYNFPLLLDYNFKDVKKISNQIIFVGGIAKIRGIFELLQAIRIVVNSGISELNLFIIGGFENSELEKDIKIFIKKLNLNEQIQFLGRKPYEEIFPYISSSQIGIATYLPRPNNMSGIPNKILEYMMLKTAVLASNFSLYKEIVENSNCGITVDPTSPEKIADALIKMLNNIQLTKQMGMNGYKSVQEKYNWANEERKLFELYDNMMVI